jgi:hypothetical protein
MRMTLPALLVLITFGSILQSHAVPQQQTACKSQIIQPVFKAIDRQPNPSGSFKGYKRFPILVFEIDESGAVENVKIKRSSGSVTADELAIGERLRDCGVTGCRYH